jgi:hypothetical protein
MVDGALEQALRQPIVTESPIFAVVELILLDVAILVNGGEVSRSIEGGNKG